MNILHIGDMAGSASITANMCTKLGHPSVVLLDGDRDAWDHSEYYNNAVYCKSKSIVKVVNELGDRYDHIVYHDRFKLAAELDHLHIPSSFMFHGNMLRQAPDLYHHVDSLESIDNLFVTTEDLLKYAPTAELFHRPVDLDLFHVDYDIKRTDIALCLTQERYIESINKLTKDEEHIILVADRVKNTRRYQDMPAFLNTFKYYYDVKYQPTHPPMIIPELSQTGLQALACGLAVWSNGAWFYQFPEIHSDEWACKEFISVLLE